MEILKCDRWENKTLIAMVGLPYSGKSTKAREISKKTGAPIVCPDTIRIALYSKKFVYDAEPMVWSIASIMVRALFLAGHNTVILDSTNISEKRRNQWRDSRWTVKWCVVDTKKADCMRRAFAVNDEVIYPVIEKMTLEYEPVEEDLYVE